MTRMVTGGADGETTQAAAWWGARAEPHRSKRRRAGSGNPGEIGTAGGEERRGESRAAARPADDGA
jgi:hypothetical protein